MHMRITSCALRPAGGNAGAGRERPGRSGRAAAAPLLSGGLATHRACAFLWFDDIVSFSLGLSFPSAKLIVLV